ncbi:MAG: hypothetical protein U1F29_12080 [Planctomycetota bacterium]
MTLRFLIALSGIAFLAGLLGPRSRALEPTVQIGGGFGCPTAAQCRCTLHDPANVPSANPPACFDHTDTSFIAGSAFHGCCRISAQCSTNTQCQYRIAIIAVAKSGQTCDFTTESGGSVLSSCPGQSTCAYSPTTSDALKCGGSQVYVVKISGSVVSTITVTCDNC